MINKDQEIEQFQRDSNDTKEKYDIKLIIVDALERLVKLVNNDYAWSQGNSMKQIKRLKYDITVKNSKTKERIDLQQNKINRLEKIAMKYDEKKNELEAEILLY